MKSISNSIALASISLLFSNTATSNEGLPESFSEYGWLLEGAREVVRRNTEFAPVTTCFDLNRMFTGEMTSSIQKERAWEDYDGKLIPLTGIVEEVKRIPITNDYLAFFKCTNSESFIVDFTVEIPKKMEEYAFELTPGERRDMYVRLTDYGEMMGVSTKLDTFEVNMGNGESCFAHLRMMSRSPYKFEYECYEEEIEAGFYTNTFNGEIINVSGGEKIEEGVAIFRTPANHPENYIAILSHEEESTFHFPGNEGVCEISSAYLENNQEQLAQKFENQETEILSIDGQSSLNGWYNNRQEFIDTYSNDEYTCREKQALRITIFSIYEEAISSGEGIEHVKELIESRDSN